jgi:RHS repeat-associated protein
MLPDPDGTGPLKRQAHRYPYNADGQMTLVELGTVPSQATDWTNFSPVEAVQSTYDTNARKTRDVLTAGGGTYGVSEYSYDTSGRQDCVATRMNTTLWGTPLAACTAATPGSDGPDRISRVTLYDALNRPKEVTTAYGTTDASVEKTAFTDNGKTASVTDAENNLTSHVYDGFDRLSQTQYPSPTKGSGTSSTSDYEQLGYDANSNVTSRRLRDGTSIGYAYDNLNRLTTKDLPGAELDVTYAYDLLGRLKSAATSAQTVSLDWDALGRQTSEAGPLGTMGYQYDAASNGTAIVWPDSNVMTYTYDATSTMTGIYQGAGTSIVMTSYVYDDLGRRTATNRRYGANTSYSYDAVSRLGGLSQDLHNAANNYSFGFTYNAAGQLASRTSSNDAYAWNGAVNADRTYTSNGLNQYGAAGTTSFGYDARGNLTTSGASTYAYSAENLLISAPGATLTYDPLGRLYQITTGSTTTRFQYIGNQIAAEYDGSNNRLRRYVPGASTDEPSFAYEGSGLTVPTWFHTDERGSVIATSDSNGLRVSSNSYDEYGIPSGSTVGRFGYTGQAYLPEIGMSYYKARMYSPTLGRFMQTDPIGYGDGLNWYNYVGSDPVNGSDPMGLKCMVGSQQFAYDEDGCNAVGGSYSPDPDVVVVGSRGGGGIVGGGNSGRGVSGTPSTGGGKGNGIKNIIRPPVVVPTCHPTPAQLANSGKVSFKFGEVSASRGVTSGNTQGSFTTAGGYSGTFRSSFDGAARGAKGFGAAAGTGWSESLATFQGVNYNLVGTLGIWDISDNFDPNSGRLVGETDAISPVGVVLGGTRSNTTILTLTCPRSN